jgi:hypothetical protein
MRLRVTPRMGMKSFPYRTRMLKATDEFDVHPGDESFFQHPSMAALFEEVKEGEAATAAADAPTLRRRGRPLGSRNRARTQAGAAGTKAAKRQAAAVKADEYHEPLEDKKVAELREMAEEQGVELPSGYVPKRELIERIEEAEERPPDDQAREGQDDDTGRF